jgi:Uma2 family endonuclease
MSIRLEPLVTVADLEAMPDDSNRYEIVAGELFLSAAPGIVHQLVSGDLINEVRSYLNRNPIGEVIATPGLILSGLDAVIPDVVFIMNERLNEVITGDRLTAAPDIVAEILSPGAENLRRDRVAKRQLYARFGVREYWILDPRERTVEVYVPDHDALKLAATLKESDQLTTPILPGFSCPVTSIFR